MIRHISAQYHLNDNWSEIFPLLTGFKKEIFIGKSIEWLIDWDCIENPPEFH